MSDSNFTRRKFLKSGAAAAVTLPVLGAFLATGHVEAQAGKPLDESSPMAKSLGFLHDASRVDIVQFPKRAGEEGKKQFCDNCQLFLTNGVVIPGQQGTFGQCALFQDGLVNAKGWCNSWVQKVAM